MTSRLCALGLATLLATVVALTACDFTRGEPLPDARSADARIDDAGGDSGGPSFARTVHAVVLARCKSCHGAGGAAGRTRYVLTGVVADDYAATRRFATGTDAQKTPLLAKARGDGHAGGATLSRTSAEYRALTAWIVGGARP